MKNLMGRFGWVRLVAVVFVAVALLGAGGPAPANNSHTLYATGFERPVFHVGNVLMGVDGWQDPTTLPPFLNPYAATISNDTAADGRQSVEVRGADLIGSGGITAPYDATGSYRHPLGQDGQGYTMTGLVAQVEADLLLETHQHKTPGEFFSLTIAGIAGSENRETLGEVGLSSQGIFEAVDFNSAPGSAPTFVRRIEFNHWYHIAMQFDYVKRRTSYFLNGHYIGTVGWPQDFQNNVLLRASMVVYARPDGEVSGGPGSHRKQYTARFDNFRVSVHHE